MVSFCVLEIQRAVGTEWYLRHVLHENLYLGRKAVKRLLETPCSLISIAGSSVGLLKFSAKP